MPNQLFSQQIKAMYKDKLVDVFELKEKFPNNILIDDDTIRTKNELTTYEIMRNIKFCVELECSSKNT